jgi:hypothetical protein
MDLSTTHVHLVLNHVPTVGYVIAVGLFVAALIARSEHLNQGGMWILLRLCRCVFGDPQLDAVPLPPVAKRLAWASLVCWLGAIVCGRLIAYLGPVAGL